MRVAVLGVIVAIGSAAPALAQQNAPLPPWAIDLRGFTTKLTGDATTAADLFVSASDLPARGFGAAVGGQIYVRRSRDRAVGVGVEALLGRGRSQILDGSGAAVATIEDRVQGVAGVISVNFGHRDGWSYLSAGIGPLRLETFTGPAPPARQPGKTIVDVGGGARWFTTRHLAFCFDVRLYLAKAIASTPTVPGRGKKSLLVLSAGVAIK